MPSDWRHGPRHACELPGDGVPRRANESPDRAGADRRRRASCSRPSPRARCGGPTSACWSSPTCTSRRARPSPAAARSCRPTTPPRRWRASRGWSRGSTRRSSSRSATAFTTTRARRACRRATATRSRRCSAAATGSGSPATTIPTARTASTACTATMLAVGPIVFRHEPRAGRGRARSPATSIRRPASPAAASRCGAAASPATATAWSCRPSAPMPAGSTCSTAAFAGLFAGGDVPRLHARRRPGLPGRTEGAPAGLKVFRLSGPVAQRIDQQGEGRRGLAAARVIEVVA